MAVVKLKYIRNKEQIKKNLHYITHRAGGEKEKMTRQIFTNNGLADKQEFDRQVVSAGRGTVFFKFMISGSEKRGYQQGSRLASYYQAHDTQA